MNIEEAVFSFLFHLPEVPGPFHRKSKFPLKGRTPIRPPNSSVPRDLNLSSTCNLSVSGLQPYTTSQTALGSPRSVMNILVVLSRGSYYIEIVTGQRMWVTFLIVANAWLATPNRPGAGSLKAQHNMTFSSSHDGGWRRCTASVHARHTSPLITARRGGFQKALDSVMTPSMSCRSFV